MKKLSKTEKSNYWIWFNFLFFFFWWWGGVYMCVCTAIEVKICLFSMSGTTTLLSKYGNADRICDPRNGEVWHCRECYPILDANRHLFTILVFFNFFLILRYRVMFSVCSALLVTSVQTILSNRLSVPANTPCLGIIVQRSLHPLSTCLETVCMTSHLRTLIDGVARVYRETLCCFGTTFIFVTKKAIFILSLICKRLCDTRALENTSTDITPFSIPVVDVNNK